MANRIGERMALAGGAYTAEVAQVDKRTWDSVLQNFSDAVLMQTWSYAAVRWGEHNLSHVVLKKDGETVAAAQCVIMKVPFLGAGMAYVKWGRIWQLHRRENNLETFSTDGSSPAGNICAAFDRFLGLMRK